ncbi:unnamed protein product [Dimorphilus gyrociliatus]|uniref:G-patch domain-containing protein n=1 Tax=Dimorphilus gyrociliatus TaxID=2664684 RepID=A0A7I8VZL7_9ANNE|nr:unnamed protein product [Dimorphilus gyrociliatus]
MEEASEFVYAAVVNIPKDSYRSVDLRAFFNEFVENGQLSCFHFLHRSIHGHKDHCVAFIKISSKFYKTFERAYHSVQYYDKHNKLRDSFCVILPLNYGKTCPEFSRIYSVNISLTTGTNLQDVGKDDFLSFREFNPPPLYPNGNVGTPSKYFNDLIAASKLPTNIIKRLELTTPRLIKKYARVRYDYPAKRTSRQKDEDNDETNEVNSQGESTDSASSFLNMETPKGCLPGERLSESKHIRLLPVSFKLISRAKSTNTREKLSAAQASISSHEEEEEEEKQKIKTSQSDSEPEEEWDRRLAISDDPMKLEHNKEIVYESPMEVVWEKGGPGLVWQTDESERRNYDFDEITTDDWDMDMAIYKKGTELCASKDAIDMAEMRKEAKNRSDGPESAFAKHRQTFPKRMLSKQGWSEGQGLGKNNQGISEALSADGQRNRRGLGYYGEKVIWKDNITKPSDKPKKLKRNPETILIASAYDNLSELDKNPEGDERASHLQMKYRDGVRFPKTPKLI